MAVAVLGLVGSWAARADAAPHRPGKGGDIGLGGSLGDPTGLSFKWFVRQQHVLESAVGFGPFHLGGGRLHASYLWHPRRVYSNEGMNLQFYLGVGLGIAFWHKRYVGIAPSSPRFTPVAGFIRAPVLGTALNFDNVPIDVFFEVAYSPIVAPPVSFWNIDAALGARYWF